MSPISINVLLYGNNTLSKAVEYKNAEYKNAEKTLHGCSQTVFRSLIKYFENRTIKVF